MDASCGPIAVLRTVWTAAGQAGACPPPDHTRRSRAHRSTASTATRILLRIKKAPRSAPFPHSATVPGNPPTSQSEKIPRAPIRLDRKTTAARSWSRKRRVIARLEETTRGSDTRYIVTSLSGEARHLYEDVYCARGQAENLIKLHKGQLASDRTSCQSPLANQLRLVLHTGAYWLMLALRDAIPRAAPLARAEFATLRLRLLKIGARVVEKAARVRIHFTSACPDAALFRLLAGRLAAAGP